MDQNNFKIRDMRHKQKFFVDDFYLNGYAKFCGINATGVYVSLCRHANSIKQDCFPSKELIAEELSISPRSVYSAIKKLEEFNIIKIQHQGKNRKKDGSFRNNIYLLLDKSIWKSKPQANNADGIIQQEPQANNDVDRGQELPNKETHYEIDKYNETHISADEQKDCDIGKKINLLFEEFRPINPTLNFGNKTQRKVLEEMINQFGFEKILKTIRYAISIQGQAYTPTITTPIQLKEKMGKLLIYYKKETSPKKGSITII